MMIKNIIAVICLLPAAVIGCPTTIDGWTFEFQQDVDVIVPNIGSVQLCEEECLQAGAVVSILKWIVAYLPRLSTNLVRISA